MSEKCFHRISRASVRQVILDKIRSCVIRHFQCDLRTIIHVINYNVAVVFQNENAHAWLSSNVLVQTAVHFGRESMDVCLYCFICANIAELSGCPVIYLGQACTFVYTVRFPRSPGGPSPSSPILRYRREEGPVRSTMRPVNVSTFSRFRQNYLAPLHRHAFNYWRGRVVCNKL